MPKVPKNWLVPFLFCFAVFAIAMDSSQDDKYKVKQKSHSWGHGFNISTTNVEDSNACEDHLSVESEDRSASERSEETRSFPNSPLTVTASRNGGIHVKTWDKPEISVKLCVAVAATDTSSARQLLSRIKLNTQGNTISVDGPENEDNDSDDAVWSAIILMHVPKGATLNLSAHNGGISLQKVTANVTAHTQNGGISLDRSSGKLDVEAQNGGISIKDCNGEVKANVRNGGLSIALADKWDGPGLDAKTQNGGIVVSVPKQFHSSLEVAMLGHGGFICQGDVCDTGQRNWDNDGRSLKIGTGNPQIRASTVNGGTVVRDRGSKDDDSDAKAWKRSKSRKY